MRPVALVVVVASALVSGKVGGVVVGDFTVFFCCFYIFCFSTIGLIAVVVLGVLVVV